MWALAMGAPAQLTSLSTRLQQVLPSLNHCTMAPHACCWYCTLSVNSCILPVPQMSLPTMQ